jgi:hypothetical protein
LIKNAIYLSLGLLKDIQATGEAFSHQNKEHPKLQNMKFQNFFSILWVIFAILDPDLDLDMDPLT